MLVVSPRFWNLNASSEINFEFIDPSYTQQPHDEYNSHVHSVPFAISTLEIENC